MELSLAGPVSTGAPSSSHAVKRTSPVTADQPTFADTLNLTYPEEGSSRESVRATNTREAIGPHTKNEPSASTRSVVKKPGRSKQGNSSEKAEKTPVTSSQPANTAPSPASDAQNTLSVMGGQAADNVSAPVEGAPSCDPQGQTTLSQVSTYGASQTQTQAQSAAGSVTDLSASILAQNAGVEIGSQARTAAAGQPQASAPAADAGSQAPVQNGEVNVIPSAAAGVIGAAQATGTQQSQKASAQSEGSGQGQANPTAPAASVSQALPTANNPVTAVADTGQSGGTAANGNGQDNDNLPKTDMGPGPVDGVKDVQITGAPVSAFHQSLTTSSTDALSRASEVPAHDQQMIQQILNKVEPAIRSGAKSLNIQLQPESLGRIDMRLTSSAEGVVVTFRASQPSTQAALENNLGDLRQALSNAGIQLNHLGVGPQGGQSGSAFAERQHSFAASYSTPNEASIASDTNLQEKTWKSAGAVDYRV